MRRRPLPRDGSDTPPRRLGGLSAALLIAGLGIAGACGDARSRAEGGVLVRDSVGVEIVENLTQAWGDEEGWRIADSAEVEIGRVEGEPEYQLFRVAGASRMRDGRIAVANAGTGELRFFDQSGRFISAIGRDGEGPGEFRRIGALWPFRGDSLIVWDSGLRRFTVISPDGVIARQARPELALQNPGMIRPLQDGSILLQDETLDTPRAEPRQEYVHLTRYAPDGTFLDSIGRFPGVRIMLLSAGGGRFVTTPRFTPLTSIVAAGTNVVVGEAVAPEVAVFGPDGSLLRRIRWPDTDRAVTQAAIDRHREDVLTTITDEANRRQQIAFLAAVPYEPTFPAYRQIVADAAGNLWIQRYRRPGDEGPARWVVIDPEGRALGEIAIPAGLHLLEIGRDHLLGVLWDDLGVERLRLYRILKP